MPRAAATTNAFIHGQAPWCTSTSQRVTSHTARAATYSAGKLKPREVHVSWPFASTGTPASIGGRSTLAVTRLAPAPGRRPGGTAAPPLPGCARVTVFRAGGRPWRGRQRVGQQAAHAVRQHCHVAQRREIPRFAVLDDLGVKIVVVADDRHPGQAGLDQRVAHVRRDEHVAAGHEGRQIGQIQRPEQAQTVGDAELGGALEHLGG